MTPYRLTVPPTWLYNAHATAALELRDDVIEGMRVLDPAMRPIKATLIHNPISGPRRRRQEIQAAAEYLTGRGWAITWAETRAAGHATRLAHDAVGDRSDLVIVAGGDGTINEAINGLAGTAMPLGILPAGTANVWALQIGIPVRGGLMDAARILAAGNTKLVDLGQAGDRYFILAAGIGLDGQVTEQMARLKRRGVPLYFLTALQVAAHYHGVESTITIDGRPVTIPLLWLVLGNLQLYGAILRIAAQAKLDDGLLDAVVFRGKTAASLLPSAANILSGGRLRVSQVAYYHAAEVQIRSRVPLPIHVDAEFIGYTPCTFRAAPHSLRMIVPADLPSTLFQDRSVDRLPIHSP